MTTLTIQIAILDAAAESLAAVADTVVAGGGDGLAALGMIAAAIPGSAAQQTLSAVPIQELTQVVSAQCRQIAQRVAAGAQTYRQMETALQHGMTSSHGTWPVPR